MLIVIRFICRLQNASQISQIKMYSTNYNLHCATRNRITNL